MIYPRHLFAALFAAVLLVACESKPVFNSLDITGIQGYGSDFRLTDHTGKARTMADFRGKSVVMFFGFTHCPDVCPTTLSDMRKVMELLGPDAGRLQVLFITVDPKRDTQDLLAKYVPSFNPTFLGLRGDQAATDKVASDFKIVHQIQEGKTPESYTVAHTAASLVFDPQGRLRLFINYGMEPGKIAADIKLLLKGTP
ncbi:MAG: SCO family protein [Betaproteobacteria bacterium]|nr:SCO family protein [Betaproteobacteria bacterium]